MIIVDTNLMGRALKELAPMFERIDDEQKVNNVNLVIDFDSFKFSWMETN